MFEVEYDLAEEDLIHLKIMEELDGVVLILLLTENLHKDGHKMKLLLH